MQLLLNIFLPLSKCVAALRCISMFLKERAAASERYQCVAASRNISMLFKECAAASEKIFNDCS